jgi:alpha-N-arabinofuranosidase
MQPTTATRREFLKSMGAVAAAATLPVSTGWAALSDRETTMSDALTINPQPRYALSPYLYMQFMEPLGTTDSSVDAAWDYGAQCWREDVVEATRDLAPPLLRWGGCYASYYRWREGVGPRDRRRPMVNLLWGGMDTGQIGTAEFVEFCRRTGADPLMCVNFESDGKPEFARTPSGESRLGDAAEAADWVRYCNDPANAERRAHGHAEPLPIKLWQIGNETSYGATWDAETCARKTVEFARAMRAVDRSLELIGWGDSGWAPRLLELAGEHLQYVAFHHMFDPQHGAADSPLRGIAYRKDPDRTWAALMDAWRTHDARIRQFRDEVGDTDMPLALTECHFSLPGRNRCEVLSTWAAGVANARLANVHERHGDRLKIATLADFCGTRWQVNALMIPVPQGRPFLMPVARVMQLYRQHTGAHAVDVTGTPEALDVTASRTGQRVFLHVVNTLRTKAVAATLQVTGARLKGGRVFTLAGDPEHEIYEHDPNVLVPVEKPLPAGGRWEFPAASVTAVEIDLADGAERA